MSFQGYDETPKPKPPPAPKPEPEPEEDRTPVPVARVDPDAVALLSRLRLAILDRPVPIPGSNLAGRIEVGEARDVDPRTSIQERTWWVERIRLLGNGYVFVAGHDGAMRLMSPGSVAWLE